MEVNVRNQSGLVEVWLTRSEKNDPQIQLELTKLYTAYKRKKYMVAVFESGEADLYQRTHDLLAHNKRRSVERAARHANKPCSAAMKRSYEAGE